MNGVTAAFCVLVICMCVNTITSDKPFPEINKVCDTLNHGKIVFRKLNGVQTGRADLHGVPGKQVKIILFSRQAPKINRKTGRIRDFACDKSHIALMYRGLEFIFHCKFASNQLVNRLKI